MKSNHTIVQLLILVFSLLSISVSNAAMVYKCKNSQGKLIYQKTPCTESATEVTAWTPKIAVNEAEQKPSLRVGEPLILKQGQNGHYFLNGEINNRALTFVVDTGASMVSLPNEFAQSAIMSCDGKDVTMETANGRSNACTTTILELKLGNFVFKNITALIVPNLSQPLLGMNALQAFDIQQKNGEMRLSARDKKAP